MNENFDDRVKEMFPLKNRTLTLKLEDDGGVDDYVKAKSVNTMPSHFGCYILSHSKRLMTNVIEQKSGLYDNSIYYIVTDSLYIHKKYWSELIDYGFGGKSLFLSKIDNGNSGIFYACFLAPKMEYTLLNDEFDVISAKRIFKGYREEHGTIKLNEFISFLEGNTVSGRISIDWTETFEGIKTPHRKQDCLDSDNGKICSDCVIKPKMNCFNCETKRTCETCLERISQKETNSTDFKR